ncbi:MAG: Cytidylate kinase [Chlamydiae bacterium]|nr:Cytidylate kinase [Chlamydiota bacterium]
MIITIDGPSGTGKTTIAKAVAERLGFAYFDTGAMYRAVSLLALRSQVDLKNPEAVDRLLEAFSFRIEAKGNLLRYFIGTEEVTEQLRDQSVNAIVSEVAALPKVREALWALQRDFGKAHSAIFEGRDMGSVVFPNAAFKIFLTATPKERARRRLEEMRRKQPKDAKLFDLKAMEKELTRRDQYDSNRPLAPLTCPQRAYKIDTTHMEIDQIVEKILAREKKVVRTLYSTLHRQAKMKKFYALIITLSSWLLKLFYRHRIYGLEHYFEGAAIIAPNHTSYLDPPIVATSWPEEVHFLAKEALFKNPLFGSFIRAVNSHPVHGDAADVAVFKKILKLLGEGKKIILFPEGGRSDGELTPLKPGIGLLLARSKAAIIPAYIHGAHTAWGRRHKFPKLWGKTACVFGSPILWQPFAHMEKKEAQEAIKKALFEAIQALKNWYDSGTEGTPP